MRSLSTSAFERAAKAVKSLAKEPSNEKKLELYALFKQAQEGKAKGPTPSLFDPIGRAKHNAWCALGEMSKDEAASKYVATITELCGGTLPASSEAASTSSSPLPASRIDSSTITDKKAQMTIENITFPRKAKAVSALSLETIQLSVSPTGVCTMRLNRPARGNAFNMAMWRDYRLAFDAINADSSVKVVILTGSKESFSTGMDLSVFSDFQKLLGKEQCTGRQREGIMNFIGFLQDAVSESEACCVPVLAAVSGQCIGGAVDVITACDLRFCTENATFCIKETDLAMVADIGTLQRLPKIISDQQTRLLAYTGRNFSGQEALALGLVLQCFKDEEAMLAHVYELAEEIATKSPLTIRGLKTTMNYALSNVDTKSGLDQVKMLNCSILISEDLQEAIRATMSKGKPVFTAE